MTLSFDTYDEALEQAQTQAEKTVICGTFLADHTTRYFLAPEDCPQEQVRDRAFEVREGRPPSEYEQFLMAQAQVLRDSMKESA